MTHERELLEPVDLCTPDGTALNPAARGWSRQPLHRANLHGRHGLNKRWDYWAVLAGDVAISAVVSNVDYIGLADVWWADLLTGESGGHGIAVPGPQAPDLPENPGTAPLSVARDGLDLTITDDGAGTRLVGTWSERDGRGGHLDVTVALPAGHESLNVVIPWSDELFNFTSKHQARPATGELVIGDRVVAIGGDDDDDDAWGVLDVGRGRWPSEISWNWGGGAGRVGDNVVGLQIGGKWTEGTGFTENGIIVDGRLTKLGDELAWEYEWDEPLRPWHVVDPGGRLDITLTPRFDKHSKVEGRKRGSETHQVFGTWQGRCVDEAGESYDIAGLQGFAEEGASAMVTLRGEQLVPSGLVERFRADGFVVVPDLLTVDELDHYAPLVTAAVNERTADDATPLAEKSRYQQSFIQCMNLWEDYPDIRPLTFHPRLGRAAAELLGVDGVRLWHDQALYKQAGGRVTDPHQDHPYWPIKETASVTAWIPFDGSTLASGAMAYLPGSHTVGLRKFVNIFFGEPHDILTDPEVAGIEPVFVEVPKGSVAFHHGLTIHLAKGNTTDIDRAVHTIIYFPDGSTRGYPYPHFAVDRGGIELGEPIASDVTPIIWPRPDGDLPPRPAQPFTLPTGIANNGAVPPD